MYIVMLSAECAPVAKVGGLADVIHGLSGELAHRGHEIQIILPKYDNMRYDHIVALSIHYKDLWVPWNEGSVRCDVWFGIVDGRKCFFIESHSQENFFNRGGYYGFSDDPERFAFFSKAALEFLLKDKRRPNVIHCHDWQTGLAPVLLYEIYERHGMSKQRVCYTIHNFRHQGVTGLHTLHAAGLPDPVGLFQQDRLQDNHNHAAVNLIKGGVVFSNFVTTVSPQHAHEMLYSEESFGLRSTLIIHRDKFMGILNGLDYDVWNPESDELIPIRYGTGDLERKAFNRDALRDRFLLRKTERPILAYVGRLDNQKGVHLICHSMHYALSHGAQFALLGSSPDPAIDSEFRNLQAHFNENPDCHLEIGFDEELAHLIYAGSDMTIVPSIYEPCGLTQMIALKYGSIPIVRSVGGLQDTIFDWDYSDRPVSERNGFTFQHTDEAALESALSRALRLYQKQPKLFRRLVVQGMQCDYSWSRPANEYLELYEFIRC